MSLFRGTLRWLLHFDEDGVTTRRHPYLSGNEIPSTGGVLPFNVIPTEGDPKKKRTIKLKTKNLNQTKKEKFLEV